MREFQIIDKIVEIRKIIRIKDLSEEFKVSTRTIKYDLNNVRDWFKENGIELCSQPNKGIWIQCTEGDRFKIKNQLNQLQKNGLYPDQETRIGKILLLLLLQNDYVTAYDIAERLNVSRNTVLNDLNYVETVAETWLIKLERKQRVGYRLEGKELHLRLLLENLIQQSLSNYDIYKITHRIKTGNTDLELYLALEEPLLESYRMIEKQLMYMFQQNILQFNQRLDLLGITIKLCVVITRLNLGFTVGNYHVLKSQNSEYSCNHIPFELMRRICNEYRLPLLQDELLYVEGTFGKEESSLDLSKVTEQIIQYVSSKEEVPYHKDSKLYSNLLSHLSLRFQKGNAYLVESNPFMESIKRHHHSLFMSIKEACVKYIGNQAVIAQDAFISYIALHFLVSYEDAIKKRKKLKVVYVCSTGRGAARIIQNKLEAEVKGIGIVAHCPLMEVDEVCRKENPDLVISVFPISSHVPVIVVETIPTKENIQMISETVMEITQGKNLETEENLFLSHHDLIGLDSEDISQEIIVKGFEVSHEVMGVFSHLIKNHRQNALMMHIFLMIHRYFFDKQYDQHINRGDDEQDPLLIEIRNVMHKHELYLNDAEMMALSQYFE